MSAGRQWVFSYARRFYSLHCKSFTYWELREPNDGSLADERCGDCRKNRLDDHHRRGEVDA